METPKSLVEGLVEVARLLHKEKRPLKEDEIKAALTKAKPRSKAAGSSVNIKKLIAAKDIAAMRAARDELDAAIKECGGGGTVEVFSKVFRMR